ncbi:MAG: hypothetical protein L0I29_00790 [Hyphomicrobiales bacterium]|nr:hypothetical protein [Hyphomicrobiales bacterium]
MHPYDHARSSAKIHGGCWSDYFAVHAWFDATKAAQCRFTHRALRHHIEGVAEAVSVFGPSIVNRDGEKVATEQLGMQHLEEDCTYPPEATVWLIDFDAPHWLPISELDSTELANASAARFGGDPSAYLALHTWFLETRNWSAGPEHLVFRHHAFGIFEAEARFGPVIALGDGKAVPTRVVAERHVQQVLGRVPSATDFLRRIKGERWMLQATSPRKLGLA